MEIIQCKFRSVPLKNVRLYAFTAMVCLYALASPAQSDGPVPILANQNRAPAGKLQSGVLNVQLEIVTGAWHPEAEDGPKLYVQAFGEAGKPAQIPGPMLRMPQGTTVHVRVKNELTVKATVYGLNTRPGDAKDAIEIPAGETRERTFAAGAPGTYLYWASTEKPARNGRPVFTDAH
jgi:FtsP/CotA-like multicopper oxidase with cupredoxin domain